MISSNSRMPSEQKTTLRFEEDGSFIGQYGTLQRRQQQEQQKQLQQQQQQLANAAAVAAAAKAAAAQGPGTYVWTTKPHKENIEQKRSLKTTLSSTANIIDMNSLKTRIQSIILDLYIKLK